MATQTINPLPQDNGSFSADVRSFLTNENAEREAFSSPGYVVSGGIGPTSGTLSHTINALTAFVAGYYVQQGPTVKTYEDNRRVYIYAHKDDTTPATFVITGGVGATFDERIGHLVFAECDVGSTPPDTPADSILLGYVDTAGGDIVSVTDLRLREPVARGLAFADRYGVVPNSLGAAAANKFAIDVMLSICSFYGLNVLFGRGVYYTTGGHAVPKFVSLFGAGRETTTIQHTTTNNSLFIIHGTLGEVALDRAGNQFHNMSIFGTGIGGTSVGFDIKNVVGLKFDFLAMTGFKYAFKGYRDNAGNSVNSAQWLNCRMLDNEIAIYGPRQWNSCEVIGGSWRSSFVDIILYDASNFVLYNTSHNFGGSATGGMMVFLGGCDGCSINPGYVEGDPTTGVFITITDNKDIDGNTSNNGIALNPGGRGCTVVGGHASSSPGATATIVKLDGCEGVMIFGPNPSSGVSGGGTVGAILFTAGTRRNFVVMPSRFHAGELNFQFADESDRAGNFFIDLNATNPLMSAFGLDIFTFNNDVHVMSGVGLNNDSVYLNLNQSGYLYGGTRKRGLRIWDGTSGLFTTFDPVAQAIQFHASVDLGFNGATPVAKPTVSGDTAGNAALQSLLAALASYGLITNSTT